MTKRQVNATLKHCPRCFADQPSAPSCTKCGLDLTTACMQCNRIGTVDGGFCGRTCRTLYRLGSAHVPATQFEEPAASAN